eukprot:gene9654-7503_t
MLRSSGIVRIAVVGDEGTGKTSLISTAANDTFDTPPPGPRDVPVADIVIQQADVVVVCFDPKRTRL